VVVPDRVPQRQRAAGSVCVQIGWAGPHKHQELASSDGSAEADHLIFHRATSSKVAGSRPATGQPKQSPCSGIRGAGLTSNPTILWNQPIGSNVWALSDSPPATIYEQWVLTEHCGRRAAWAAGTNVSSQQRDRSNFELRLPSRRQHSMEAQKPIIQYSCNKYERQRLLHAEGRQAPSRVLFSPFIYSTPSICSEGACMLRGSSNFDSIPVAPESESNATLLVGYFANSLWSLDWRLRGRYPTQQFLFLLLNNHVPRIVSAFAGTQSAWGSLGSRVLRVRPQTRYPSHWMRWGSDKGFRRSIEWTPAEPWWLLSVTSRHVEFTTY